MAVDVERLYALRKDCDRIAQRWTRIIPKGDVVGVSAGGTVEVVVDGNGMAVKAVVREGWRDVVPETELGFAVVEAYNNASISRFAELEKNREIDEKEPDPPETPVPIWSETIGDVLHDYVDQHGDGPEIKRVLDRLSAMMQEILDNLDEVVQTIESRVAAEYVGTDAGRVVRVTVQGSRQLLAVNIDQAWLQSRHAANVTARICEAMVDAYRVLALSVPEDMMSGTLAGDFMTMMNDPRLMVHKLSS